MVAAAWMPTQHRPGCVTGLGVLTERPPLASMASSSKLLYPPSRRLAKYRLNLAWVLPRERRGLAGGVVDVDSRSLTYSEPALALAGVATNPTGTAAMNAAKRSVRSFVIRPCVPTGGMARR